MSMLLIAMLAAALTGCTSSEETKEPKEELDFDIEKIEWVTTNYKDMEYEIAENWEVATDRDPDWYTVSERPYTLAVVGGMEEKTVDISKENSEFFLRKNIELMCESFDSELASSEAVANKNGVGALYILTPTQMTKWKPVSKLVLLRCTGTTCIT